MKMKKEENASVEEQRHKKWLWPAKEWEAQKNKEFYKEKQWKILQLEYFIYDLKLRLKNLAQSEVSERIQHKQKKKLTGSTKNHLVNVK